MLYKELDNLDEKLLNEIIKKGFVYKDHNVHLIKVFKFCENFTIIGVDIYLNALNDVIMETGLFKYHNNGLEITKLESIFMTENEITNFDNFNIENYKKIFEAYDLIKTKDLIIDKLLIIIKNIKNDIFEL